LDKKYGRKEILSRQRKSGPVAIKQTGPFNEMKKITLILTFFILPCVVLAQEKWDLKKSANGIKVYTRKLDNEKFKEVKVLCEINAPAERLISVLQNVAHHKDWVYQTKLSYLVSRRGRDTVTYYSEVMVPWPVSNRDFVVQLAFHRDSANKVLKIRATSIPKLLPEKPDIVRVPYSLGLWNVYTLPDNRIKIEYTLSVNPGGSLPVWLVNLTATAGPFDSFKKLKEILEKKSI
jgi:hypothetical protein